MGNRNIISSLIMIVIGIFASQQAFGQDKVYLTSGKIMDGKVTEVSPKQVKLFLSVRTDGPVYVYNTNQIDSIVYSNGVKDVLDGVTKKKNKAENIPQLNTWQFDVLGLTFLSVSQSYERRLKNGKVGFRVPLYIGFLGGGIAGTGVFNKSQGVFYPNSSRGFSIATGLNTKCYLFKRRVIRAFVGPEATVGFSRSKNDEYYTDYSDPNYPTYYDNSISNSVTFTALGKAGLVLNPVDKFTICIDGGAGVGGMYGGSRALGTVGVWHIGIALGTNF